MNLLSNAAHACGFGDPEAHVVEVIGRREGDTVVLRVVDDGCGMTEDEAAQALVPFFTTRDVGEGTGLGLSISHGIVGSMGGSMELESALGAGTTVWIRLPAVDIPDAPVTDAAPAPTALPTAPLRILAIDDEPEIHALLREALHTHRVESAHNGTEALERLAATPWDVVLLDVMMPRMSGIEVLRRLEADAPDVAAKVVLITGDAFTPKTRAFLDETTRPCLTKPFQLAELHQLVHRVAAAR